MTYLARPFLTGGTTGEVLTETGDTFAWGTQTPLSGVGGHAPGNPAAGTAISAARIDHVHPDNGIYYVTGAPSNTVGGNGASAIDTTNDRIYGPKASGAWPATYFNLGARFDPETVSGFVGRWTADDLALTDGADVTAWTGTNGHTFSLYAGTPGGGYTVEAPHYTVDPATNLPVIRFDPGAAKQLIQTLVLDASQTFKHAFVVAKHTTAANEVDFEGLLTGPTSSDVCLTMRESTGINTFDLTSTLASASYRFNGTPYASGGIFTALGPRNVFGVMSLSRASSFSFIPQVGGDRDNPSRGWKGDIREVWLYTNELTGSTLTDVEQFLKARSFI